MVRTRDSQSSGRVFESHSGRLETLAISFTPLCHCLSEETLKAVGPFYLVSMPGEGKDPTHGVNVLPVVDSMFYLVSNVFRNDADQK